jgi:tryptophan 2,3-dioxygenase
MDLTYGSYLRLDQLLDQQRQQSEGPEHDELLFIIIHQTYELWFKQLLHELDQFVRHLTVDDVARAGHTLKRVLKIFKTLVSQLDILETMTPLEFRSFRAFLASSSGFQSAQFREVEFVLGMKDRLHLDRFVDDEGEHERLQRRFDEPSVWDVVLAVVDRSGFAMPSSALVRDVTEPVVEDSDVQAVLVEVYRNEPTLSGLLEALTDLDEGLQEWRYRHVMMVQRTIGTQMGTGGSAGAEYLRTTLFRPAFPDLWAVRSQF